MAARGDRARRRWPAERLAGAALGRIVHLSHAAYEMLLLARGDISPAAAARMPAADEFLMLALLHRRLTRAAAPCAVGAPQALALTNARGTLRLQRRALRPIAADGPRLVGVTIRHLVPRTLGDLRAVDAAPLSITQEKVCALLLQGLTHVQVAARLGVSTSTAINHVRKIHVKLGAHSVEELRARRAPAAAR